MEKMRKFAYFHLLSTLSPQILLVIFSLSFSYFSFVFDLFFFLSYKYFEVTSTK